MNTIDALLNYLASSSSITVIVLLALSFYFILTFWIFFYRFARLSSIQKKEASALEMFAMGGNRLSRKSLLSECVQKGQGISRPMLEICQQEAVRSVTIGLAMLSIIASTSPFIGLFGTVVSILESFAQFGAETKASLSVIAPVISEALVATAAGILVAIPAYSFHLILKRKAFEIMNILQREIDLLIYTHQQEHTIDGYGDDGHRV